MSDQQDSGRTDAGSWRVRITGTTFRVKDRAALTRLIESGKIPADAQLQEPGSDDWQGLSGFSRAVDALAGDASTAQAGQTSDPWSAWEDLDEDAEQPSGPVPVLPAQQPEELGPGSTADPGLPDLPDLPELPEGALSPVQRTSPRATHPGTARPRSPASPAQPVGASGGGKVIPFPEHRASLRSAAATAGPSLVTAGPSLVTAGPSLAAADPSLATETVPFPGSRAQPRETTLPDLDLGPLPPGTGKRARLTPPQPRPNWWRVAAVGAVGLLVLVAMRAYVSTYTTPEYAPPTPRPAVPPGAAEHLGAVPQTRGPSGAVASGTRGSQDLLPGPQVEDSYQDVERELRALMMSGTLDCSDGDALETSLLIELNRIRLGVEKVDIRVLSTVDDVDAGVPTEVEIRVILRSDGTELDRELAAAALVVGKYVHTEALTAPVFEVAFDGLADGKLMRTRVDAHLAQQFSLGRLSMGDFLAAVTR